MEFNWCALIRSALNRFTYALCLLLHMFIETFWFIAMATKAHEGHIIAEMFVLPGYAV